MTAFHRGPMLALDFESCGLPAHDTRAVQIGLAWTGPDGATPRTYLVDPGQPIPPEATAIHGITDAMVAADGLPYRDTLADVAEQVCAHLGEGLPLVAMNAAFDCTLLEAELARLGIPTVTEVLGRFAPVIDPHVIDKAISRRPGKRTLQALCTYYGVRNDSAHDAGEDALAAARVTWKIAHRHPSIGNADLFELHQKQIHWRQEQMDSLRGYFDRKDISHDGCDPRWPLQLPVLDAHQAAS
jgi:DNA polymerase III subunit epsilon